VTPATARAIAVPTALHVSSLFLRGQILFFFRRRRGFFLLWIARLESLGFATIGMFFLHHSIESRSVSWITVAHLLLYLFFSLRYLRVTGGADVLRECAR
jgi:hypothetical protein